MRNLFIDLDGTLTDSRPGLVRCFQYAMVRLGQDPPAEKELLKHIGPPLAVTFSELLATSDQKLLEEAIRHFRGQYSASGMFENSVYPGIPEALTALQEAGCPCWVVTSKLTVAAERILEHFGLREFFQGVHGSPGEGRYSDKADLIRNLLAEEALEAGETVMIGDRKFDIEGGLANGTAAVGVTWGYGSREELLTSGAHRLCDSPSELTALCRPAKI